MTNVWVYWLEGADVHQYRWDKADVKIYADGTLTVSLPSGRRIIYNANVWIRFEVDSN
jgi:hypothetical protein